MLKNKKNVTTPNATDITLRRVLLLTCVYRAGFTVSLMALKGKYFSNGLFESGVRSNLMDKKFEQFFNDEQLLILLSIDFDLNLIFDF